MLVQWSTTQANSMSNGGYEAGESCGPSIFIIREYLILYLRVFPAVHALLTPCDARLVPLSRPATSS